MRLSRPDYIAYGVVVVCVVGIVVLTALRVPVPDFLTFAGTTALGIGGGVALQGANAAAVGEVAAAPVLPAPTALTAEPATGVMRIATHAP